MNWEKSLINIGSVKEDTSKEVLFKRKTKEPKVAKILVGCSSCTKVKGYDSTTGILKLVYRASKIPTHLKINGATNSIIRKNIKVYYEDGSSDILYIEGKIVKR